MHTSTKTHNAQKNTLLVDTRPMLFSITIASLTTSHFPAFSVLRSNGRQRNRFYGRRTTFKSKLRLARPGDNHTLMMPTILLVAHLSNTPNSLRLIVHADSRTYGLYCKPTSHHPTIATTTVWYTCCIKVLPKLWLHSSATYPTQLLISWQRAWVEATHATDSPGRHESHPHLVVKASLLDSSWSSQFVL